MSLYEYQLSGFTEAVLAATHVQVVMPPERYIPLAVHEIIDAIRSSVAHADRGTFNDICQLMEGCATTEFSALRRRVKKNFRFFSAAAMHKDLPTRKGRGSATFRLHAATLLRFCKVCKLRAYASSLGSVFAGSAP
jgi:hypothetical protein